MDDRRVGDRPDPGAARDTRPLLALTMAAAGTDAVSYLGLGHVFCANMTGNTVLLGLGVATGDFGAPPVQPPRSAPSCSARRASVRRCQAAAGRED